MGKKTVVYLKTAEVTGSLETKITSRGWEIQMVSSTSAAKKLAGRDESYVGLLTLDEQCLNGKRQEIEEMLVHTKNVQWIGLAPAALLEKPLTRKLIAQYLYDYHTLPADGQRLLNTLGHAYGMAQIRHCATTPTASATGYDGMVGRSEGMLRIYQSIRKIASTNAPVLITGESGTGKELVARAIHRQSGRVKGPFIPINCGALPATLIQSELFGHEKGAFTGAHRRFIGHIEAAHGGTVFLDEIGDLPLGLQKNLLRFLQEGTIERLGGTKPIPVDVRIVTATHVDLRTAIKMKRFRSDLYFRLNVLSLELPPLRGRDDDVQLLAHFFLDKFAKERSSQVTGFDGQALRAMGRYDWPGNVRELMNRVRRACIMGEHRFIRLGDLGLEQLDLTQEAVTLVQARAEAERQVIKVCLVRSGNKVSDAARQLGISRFTLYRLLDKHALGQHKW